MFDLLRSRRAAPPRPAPPEPPKLPQFSDTRGQVLLDVRAATTTCSHTSPRSSLIEVIRSPYGSSRRWSSQRSREQTEVASSDTFSRCVLANSEKMLFGWSAEVGSLSLAGRLPSMIAGCARSVES